MAPELAVRSTLWRWVLAGWTVVIWASRLRNALADDDLSGNERTVALLVAVVFVGLGLALVAMLIRGRRLGVPSSPGAPPTVPSGKAVVEVLAVAGIARWTLRAPLVLLSDEWSDGFKAVHTTLWLVTVVLSVLAWREVRR